MEESDFSAIIALITSQTGIIPRESHKTGIKNFIDKRMRELDLKGIPYHSYLRINGDEFDRLINAATVNETYFFREEAQFKLLKEKILPALRAKRGSNPLRIWSAAASSGEEIYSLYLLASSLGIKSQCIASDINDDVLNKCGKGLYSAASLKSDGSKFHYLLAPFQKIDKSLAFPQSVSSKIERQKLNLCLENAEFPKNINIVFMRNVFIYFSMEMRKQILKKIVEESLCDDGFLFVSMSEIASFDSSIVPKCLEKCSDGKVFYFHKK